MLMNSSAPQLSQTERVSESCIALKPGIKLLLEHWYFLRYSLDLPTEMLMSNAHSEKERFLLGIVALMDLEPKVLHALVPVKQRQFVDTCHAYLRQQLHRTD